MRHQQPRNANRPTNRPPVAVDNDLFRKGTSAGGLFGALYRQRRKADPAAWSLSAIAAAVSYASKGNLSAIMRGKRRLPPKLLEPLSKLFALNRLQLQILRQMLCVERCKDSKQRAKEAEALSRLRRNLDLRYVAMPTALIGQAAAFEVYASMGLFQEPVAAKQLISCLGEDRSGEVRKGLDALVACGLLRKDPKGFCVTDKNIIFSWNDLGWQAQKQMLKAGLERSVRDLERIDPRTNMFFVSFVASMERDAYVKALNVFRDALQQFMGESKGSAEEEPGDEQRSAVELIRISAQFYPFREGAVARGFGKSGSGEKR